MHDNRLLNRVRRVGVLMFHLAKFRNPSAQLASIAMIAMQSYDALKVICRSDQFCNLQVDRFKLLRITNYGDLHRKVYSCFTV